MTTSVIKNICYVCDKQKEINLQAFTTSVLKNYE